AAARLPEEDLSLARIEREHVRRVLDSVGGNKSRAARALGISRTRLLRKLVDSR
ncbi:sigma-54-dependent Fis family transcriptional regulator, partial [Acidobacteria bacterium ACD]|nr:sigma-54-dependent Fis family transcriptional regulator [Acidobacteria bacterium ACD]